MTAIKLRLLVLAVVAGWFLCPLPQPSAIKTVEVKRPGPPSFMVVNENIVCARRSDELLLREFPQMSEGRLQLDVIDTNEKVLAGPFVLTGDKGESVTFVTDGGFPRGRTYRLRCTEEGVVGSYRLSVSQPWRIALGQRYVAAVSILAVGLVVAAGLGVFGIGGAAIRRTRNGLGRCLFLATFWLAYPAIHEAGHVLALQALHAWEPAGTSLLPLNGQRPHVSATASAHLAPWQIRVMKAYVVRALAARRARQAVR